MAGEMGFAGFAAEDPVGVEVGVVEEAHPHCWWDLWAEIASRRLEVLSGLVGFWRQLPL